MMMITLCWRKHLCLCRHVCIFPHLNYWSLENENITRPARIQACVTHRQERIKIFFVPLFSFSIMHGDEIIGLHSQFIEPESVLRVGYF